MDEDLPLAGPLKRQIEQEARRRIRTLRDLGISEAILEILTYKLLAVVNRVIDQHLFNGSNLPLVIPVLPLHFVPLKMQLTMIGKNKISGNVRLNDSSKVVDLVETPHKPYFILNVLDKPNLVPEDIGYPRSSPLTVVECLALDLHEKALSSHGLVAGNTRYEDDELRIHLGVGSNQHTLSVNWSYLDELVEGAHTPLCQGRH